MRDLLKADLRRMFRDKLFLIAVIIGGALAIFTPLLYKGLMVILDVAADTGDLFDGLFTSKMVLGSSFAPMNNYGLILPIFLAIIIYKDFSYGTIRNKIISGKSRVSIYLSLLLSSAIVMTICMLGYALIQFGFASLLLDYSIGVKMVEDLPYIILTLLFGVICYLFITSIIVFLCASFKNVGLAIVLYFGGCFLLTIFATITSTAYSAIEMLEGKAALKNVFEFLTNINLFYFLNGVIGYVDEYLNTEIAYIIIDSILFGGLFVLFGILIFKKKDLK